MTGDPRLRTSEAIEPAGIHACCWSISCLTLVSATDWREIGLSIVPQQDSRLIKVHHTSAHRFEPARDLLTHAMQMPCVLLQPSGCHQSETCFNDACVDWAAAGSCIMRAMSQRTRPCNPAWDRNYRDACSCVKPQPPLTHAFLASTSQLDLQYCVAHVAEVHERTEQTVSKWCTIA